MIHDFEYGVDSRYKNKKERESDSVALMQARLERMKAIPREQIIRAKLLQLKLKMEAYLKEPVYDNNNHFTDFLEMYIDAIYPQRSKFAEDINVTPVFLSQIINNHREPKEEFILKLMIHSEKMFKNVCEFHKKTWYQVYYQEKISDTMSSQEQWRPGIEKQVKISELSEM
ncbi:hypothetical protein [Sediminibacterium ginsengisoli]|uniref:Uncharacterized protein n=1 Tax=Sediminibacterium ginsengisoli TaxID=413434 RepID=A0A1T4RGY2_9BACT|nr:hypothetical protein [Sediminibacterium ginsengisoli]SKA14911.1 hypothetical protein SAMN04488132_11232 [Sediminibacterium ginsengisoli]